MSNNMFKQWAQGSGGAMSFPRIGDYITGNVVDCESIDDQHNPGSQILRIKLAVAEAVVDGQPQDLGDDQALRDLYIRGPGMREAIGKAVVAAGADSIEPGDRLERLEYVGDKATGKGRPMKLYRAEFKPATEPTETAPF